LNATSLETTLDGVYAQLAASSNTFLGSATFVGSVQGDQSGGAGHYALSGYGDNGSVGVYGDTDSGYGVEGNAISGTGVYGSSDNGVGTEGSSTAADTNGVVGDESGTGGYGVYGHASGAEDSTRYASVGVYGLADSGTGVQGIAVGNSGRYNAYLAAGYTGGAWGDTSANGSSQTLSGIVGSADDNDAAYFVNDSADSTTVFATNESSGGIINSSVPVFTAMGAKGICGMNGAGDVTCSGRIKTAVPLAGSEEKVEVYSVQSSENWFEDFGSAQLENGHVTVAIDPRFAGIVNTGVEYHVFLTPNGNCKGLYVATKSANGFEVRELGDGGSSVTFDYRIVAKRAGHETERLGDATAEMHTMTARHDVMKARLAAAPPAKALPAGKDIAPVRPSSQERSRSAQPMRNQERRP
jgi:hypothetical protein